jgi:hypothetical protein
MQHNNAFFFCPGIESVFHLRFIRSHSFMPSRRWYMCTERVFLSPGIMRSIQF